MKEGEVQNQFEKRKQMIDSYALLLDIWKEIRKFWWELILVCMIAAGGVCLFTKMTYRPQYFSEVSFTVSVKTGGSEGDSAYGFYYNTETASQMNHIFPVLLQSDALKKLILDDLRMDEMPGALGASMVKGSNLVTMTAAGSSPQSAKMLLDSAVKCFPELSYYVIGETKFHILQESQSEYRSPDYLGVSVKGMLAVCVSCVVILCAAALMRKTISTEAQCREVLHIQVIGKIPRVRFKRHNRGFDQTLDIHNERVGIGFQEAMGNLALQVEHDMGAKGKKSLLVTSTLPNEGKSTIAWNLSKCISELGNRILLVDVNLRKPSLGTIAGNPKAYGLPEVLNGQKTESEAVYRPGNENLYVLSGRRVCSQPLVLLHSARFASWISQKQKEYDYVILDAGSCSVTADAAAAAEQCEAVLYVIRQDTARQSQILNSLKTVLFEKKGQLAAAVLNDVTLAVNGYEKYYSGNYNTIKKKGHKAAAGKENRSVK